MKQKKVYISLGIIIFVSFLLNVFGIRWGLPGRNIIGLVFGNEKIFNILVPVMSETRQEIRQMIKSPGDKYLKDYDENRIVDIDDGFFTIPLTVGTINAMRTYLLRTYYPDEHTTLTALSNINPKEKQFSPKVLVPGCFYVYASGLWLGICNLFHLIKLGDSAFYLEHPWELGRVYLAGRMLLIFVFLFCIYLVWLISNNIWGSEVGLISAFLFGISPVLNMWNHFGYYYGFTLLFVLLSFLYSLKIYTIGNLKYYIASAICAAIAMSIVSLYGVAIVFMIIAGLMTLLDGKRLYEVLKNIAVGIMVLVGIFIAIHIFLILDKETFLKVLRFEGGDFKFSPDFFYFVFASLKSGLGWPFLLSALAGYILLCVKKKDSNSLFFITSIIIPFLIFCCFSPWYIRRGIFLIPFMAIFAGIFLVYAAKRYKILGGALVFFVCLLTFFYSAACTALFVQRNIREEAGQWINMNIPEGTKIGMLQMPAPYRTPPFQFYRYHIIPIPWDSEKLKKEKPDYFVISEYETLWQVTENMDNFFRYYSPVKIFQKPACFCGIRFNRTQFSAKDVWVVNPYIIIYKRNYVEE